MGRSILGSIDGRREREREREREKETMRCVPFILSAQVPR